MTDGFLTKVYDLDTADETRALYDQWAASYDAEVGEYGYATPARAASALAAVVEDTDTPILDYGCGTGLSGLGFKMAGFSTIDGMDPSPEMLAGAREKELYRALYTLDLDNPTPIKHGSYPIIAAIGVIGRGAAPLATFDLLMDALALGGLLVFTFNDHTLEDPAYAAKVVSYIEADRANLLIEDYGAHLPGADIKSRVTVLAKT